MQNKASGIFKKTWVFFLSAGLIILSTGLLAFGISTLQRSQTEETPDSFWGDSVLPNLSDATAAAEQVAEENSTQQLPNLLVSFDPSQGGPSSNHISLNTAVDTAARMVTQVFGEDLDGAICQAYFYGDLQLSPESSSDWAIEFGNYLPATRQYNVTLDATSGTPRLLSFFYNTSIDPETGELLPHAFKPVPPGQFEQFQDESVEHAKLIAQEFLGSDSHITRLQLERKQYDLQGYATWAETPLGYAPNINIYVSYSDGRTILFSYSTEYGELSSIDFTATDPSRHMPETTAASQDMNMEIPEEPANVAEPAASDSETEWASENANTETIEEA